MQLNDEQKREVARWIEAGAKLSEVQQRLGEEFGIRLTYMEARFLVDDLKLVPKEQQNDEKKPEEAGAEPAAAEPKAAGGVRVETDAIMRPGALISGKVTFSDGETADWALDQTGRFGLYPAKEGYRPSQADLNAFRKDLERELQKQGL